MEVKIKCENCGNEKWVRWIRVKNGQGRFCGLECANIAQRKWGKENVYFYLDNLKGRWVARWRDKNTGNFYVQHRSKFLWEQENGKVSEGYDIHHIDEDIRNDDLGNLEMVEGRLHKQGVHGSSRKIIDGVVHKQCFSCKQYFPETSYVHRPYCKPCYAEYMREYRKRRK